jgi:SulP family sulfate permease
MVATVAVVVATHNLAIGVLVGVLLSGIFFAWKISQIFAVDATLSEDGRVRTYQVKGQVFFASAHAFIDAFDYEESVNQVIIDVTRAHFWDISAVAALDKVMLKLRRGGATVSLSGMNDASSTIVDRLAIHDKVEELDLVPGH